MADKDGLRYAENPSGEHNLPCADETQGHWPAPIVPLPSPMKSQIHDHYDLHDHEHHHKKSVLAKLKDKAKKWKHSLSKKKHGHDQDEDGSTPTSTSSSTPTSTCSSTLYEDVKGEEEDPEYYGAPMYESESAPTAHKDQSPRTPYKDLSPRTPNKDHSPRTPKVHFKPVVRVYEPKARQPHDADKKPELHHLNSFKESAHNSTAPATADKVVAELQAEQEHPVDMNEPGNYKTLTETVTEMLAPAYKMVSDATQMIASKIQRPTARDEIGAKMMWDKGVSAKELGTKMMWDKGVSAKEYLRNKLEPGEEDKALSEVITEAMSPRNAGPGKHQEMSMVEKVRQALYSLLAKDKQMGRQPTQVISRTQQSLSTIKAPASTHQSSLPAPLSNHVGGVSPPIPVSTNPYAEVEEPGGRRRWKETTSICQLRTN